VKPESDVPLRIHFFFRTKEMALLINI